jgi:hypothetical protein
MSRTIPQSSKGSFEFHKALEATDVVDRRIVTIPAKDWKKFEAWANRAAEEIEGLKNLACLAPTWRE